MNISRQYTAHFSATQFYGNVATTTSQGTVTVASTVYVTQQDTNAPYIPVVTMSNCHFSKNRDGGLVMRNLGNLSIMNSKFSDNGQMLTGLFIAFDSRNSSQNA